MPPKRGSGQGKNQKTTRRGRSPERREATPESFVPDATWVELTGLDLHGKYMSFRPPPEFMQAMVHDAKNWSETEDRSIIRTVAAAVAKVVMPILVDFQMWRLHINNHLQRLCASRRLFRCETQRFVTRLGERCSDLEEQISQFARIVPQLQERCNNLDERTSSLRSQIKRLESEVERLESEGRSKHTSVAGASTPGPLHTSVASAETIAQVLSQAALRVLEKFEDRIQVHQTETAHAQALSEGLEAEREWLLRQMKLEEETELDVAALEEAMEWRFASESPVLRRRGYSTMCELRAPDLYYLAQYDQWVLREAWAGGRRRRHSR